MLDAKTIPFTLTNNYFGKDDHGSFTLPPSTSNSIILFFVRQGSVSAKIGKQCFQIESDQCICIMPGMEHAFRSADPYRPFFYDAVYFNPELLYNESTPVFAPFYDQLNARKSSITFVVTATNADGRSVLHFLTELISLLKTQPVGYEVGCKAYLELILFKLVSMNEVQQATVTSSDTIQTTINYIEANYMDKISIDTLARLCCMSKYHFIRCFFSITGQTPVEYINSFRIKTACRLLREQSDDKIISISLAVGFNDLSNFNRTFKRIIGQTPVEYRRDALRRAQYNQSSIFFEEYSPNVPFYSFML